MVATQHHHEPAVHNGQSRRPPGPPGAPGLAQVSLGSWDLVAAAQGGDRDAFGQLYQRYARQVAGVVYSRTRDHTLAEDLTSETFLRALRSLDSVTDQGRDIGVWLTVIARHVVADHYKAAGTRRETPTADVPEFPPDPVSHPERMIVDDDTAGRLQSGIAGLAADSRRCLWLRFYRDLSVTQTAAVMSRTPASVKALQYRALNRLRAALADEEPPGARGPQPAPSDPLDTARAAVTAAAQRASRQRHADHPQKARSAALDPTHDQDRAGDLEDLPLLAAGGGPHG